MTDSKTTPPTECDPAVPTDVSETHHETNDHKPRDSKGWDGKLRIDKLALNENEPADPTVQVESEPEVSDDEGPPPEQLAADEDLLDDVPDDEDEIELVHCKISDMDSLRLERFKQIKVHHHSHSWPHFLLTNAAPLPPPKPHRNRIDTGNPRIDTPRS